MSNYANTFAGWPLLCCRIKLSSLFLLQAGKLTQHLAGKRCDLNLKSTKLPAVERNGIITRQCKK